MTQANGSGAFLASPAQTAVTTKAADDPAVVAAVEHKTGVKGSDYAEGMANFIFPAYGYNAFLRKSTVLPVQVPEYNRYNFYTQRNWTLLGTPYHEGLWADAIATAVTKAAAWGWEVEGTVALQRKRLQELLQYATAGVFMGWVPFVSAHLRSYLLCGYAVVEIARERNNYASKITGLNHLNPLRCRFTDNPIFPVEYMDRQAQIHQLHYSQVMMFADQLSPTEGELSLVESAAERAYTPIKNLEAISIYLYEKITGGRPLSIEFIMGVTEKRLKEMVSSAEHDQDRKGSVMFKGAIMVPVPGDIPVQRVSIPIAELPDGFNYQEIHDNSVIEYAAAIGMDVNDIDPRLGQRSSLGSGAQSVILDQKTRGKGLAAWKEAFAQEIHRLVAGTAVTFSWSEDNADDAQKKAQLESTRAGTRKQMIDNGEIDAAESRNLAVDAGDLPKEFLKGTDLTAGGTVDSDDNANDTPEKAAGSSEETAVSPPAPVVPTPPAQPEQKKEFDPKKAREEAIRLIASQAGGAVEIAAPMVEERPLEEALGVAD